jgi:hypothetical protein
MSGSALPNTFRLIICRGCSVHELLRPAGLLPSVSRAFDTPLGSGEFLPPAGVCYRALRRLPGRDLHPLERRVFQDAPWIGTIRNTRISGQALAERLSAHGGQQRTGWLPVNAVAGDWQNSGPETATD